MFLLRFLEPLVSFRAICRVCQPHSDEELGEVIIALVFDLVLGGYDLEESKLLLCSRFLESASSVYFGIDKLLVNVLKGRK